MDRLIIKGKADLKGSIQIKGSKNSALPIMVSALLSKKTLKLNNDKAIIKTEYFFLIEYIMFFNLT